MQKSKSTRSALLCSVLATVLCAAMLVGTTFAWFTDSVTSGRNRIAAGNLDVELYHGDALDETVNGATDLFTNADGSAILWEPGAIACENFKVANEGSLALKYQLSINIVDYNTVDGKSLADVLKVAVLEGETFTGDRAAAQGLTYESTLSDFVKEGNLLPEEADTYAVVIYWEPSANDNDYNLNNGKTSSDGEPLYIDLGITLTAAQDTVESDSFDNQYDAGALYPALPAAISVSVGGTVGGAGETTLSSLSGDAAVVIPANALDEETAVHFQVETKEITANSVTYDINLASAEGESLTLNSPVTITLQVGKGLADVAVAHNGVAMDPLDYSYDAMTGILTIVTDSFSPFQITYTYDFAAAIDGKGYASLEDAVAAGGQNDVIYLLKNIALTEDIQTDAQLAVAAGATVTLDLAGHKITSNYAGISIVNYGTMTIDDSVGNGIVHNISAEVGDNYSHDAVRNYGVLTINGGIFGDNDTDPANANTEHRGAALRNMEGAVCEVNGGSFTCGDNYYTWGTGTGYSYAIRSSGTLTINGGTLYGSMNGGISADAGHITINDGNFSVTGKSSFYVLVTSQSNGGTITVNGGTFTKTNGNGGLLGGFSGMPSWDAAADLAANGYTITSGTFIMNGETVVFS